jgi:formate dehydrogenase maturation protein FdhE
MKKVETDADEELRQKYEFGALREMNSGVGLDWQALSAESHYQTAVQIERALLDGNYGEAEAGIKELIEALGRSEKRALKSQIVRLMAHIIKWQTQPDRRSYGWVASIYSAREEIADIQGETPSLTNDVVRDMWDKCLRVAIREAEGEMSQKSSVSSLSRDEVFEEEYELK